MAGQRRMQLSKMLLCGSIHVQCAMWLTRLGCCPGRPGPVAWPRPCLSSGLNSSARSFLVSGLWRAFPDDKAVIHTAVGSTMRNLAVLFVVGSSASRLAAPVLAYRTPARYRNESAPRSLNNVSAPAGQPDLNTYTPAAAFMAVTASQPHRS